MNADGRLIFRHGLNTEPTRMNCQKQKIRRRKWLAIALETKATVWLFDYMRRLILPVAAACVAVIVSAAFANRPAPIPRFGTPIVVQDRLVFTGPDFYRPHRLICIDAETGTKYWEITNRDQTIGPWFTQSNSIIVTVGGTVCRCDPNDGALKALYESGCDQAFLTKLNSGSVLLEGKRNTSDVLVCLDPNSWAVTWEKNIIGRIIAIGQSVLLCNAGELDAISMKDGHQLWSRPLPFLGHEFSIRDYFVIQNATQILAVKQSDGTAVEQVPLSSRVYFFTVDPDNAQIFFTAHKEERENGFPAKQSDYFSYFSITVPQLELKEISKTDWEALQEQQQVRIGTKPNRVFWKEQISQSISSDYVYFSEWEVDGVHTAIMRINRLTGAEKKLYEEELPVRMQRPRR